jgi:hypothetical protein
MSDKKDAGSKARPFTRIRAGGNKTAGAEHIVANRFIVQIPGKLKPEGGSEIDELKWLDRT